MKRKKPKKEFTTTWAFEAFDRDPTFLQKRMFGCLAAYVRGRMVMALAEDPGEKSYRSKTYDYDIWDGILLPTERSFHESLLGEFPSLVSHPVLGKWLYLPAKDDIFESIAQSIGERIAAGDKRFGIEARMKPVKKRKKTR